MDSKLKYMQWPANIFQKFETVCQEVDSIMKENSRKYVENQVQSMGKSMKKFCGVFQDLLPPILDPLECEAQGQALKSKVSSGDYIKPEVGIERNHIDLGNKPSHVEPGKVSPMLDHAFNGLSLTVTNKDSLEGTEFGQAPGQIADISPNFAIFLNRKTDVNIEENSIKENLSTSEISDALTCVEEEHSLESSLLTEIVDCDDQIPYQLQAKISPSTPLHEKEFEDDSDCVFNDSTVLTSSEKQMPEVVDLSSDSRRSEPYLLGNSYEESPEEAEFSPSSPLHEEEFEDDSDCVFNDSTVLTSSEVSPSMIQQAEVSPSTPLHEKEFEDDSDCVFNDSTVLTSSEKQMPEVVDLSSDSLRSEPYLLGNSYEESPEEAEFSHKTIVAAGFVSQEELPSSALTTNLSTEDEIPESGYIPISGVMSQELIEAVSETESRATVTATGIHGDTNAHFCEPAQFEAAIVSSDVGPSDDSIDAINDSSMETIELCDKGELENTSAYIDSGLLYAVSGIVKKKRSYKKIIKDAFTSRKRLVKEYEQLAIWFGDADMGSDKVSFRSVLPPTTATTMEHQNLGTDDTSDSEWELL